jgi:gas vesicle protein
MRNHHDDHGEMNSRDVLIGVAAGGLIGVVAALLIAPKSGEELRDDICDTYCNVTERGRHIAKSISDTTKDVVDHTSRGFKRLVGQEVEEEDHYKNILLGGGAGIVIGALLGLLIAPKAGNELREDLVHAYEDANERAHEFANDVSRRGHAFAKNVRSHTEEWLDLAKKVVDQVAGNVHDKSEEIIHRVKDLIPNGKANDIAQWAILGFRLWKGVQRKKRRS